MNYASFLAHPKGLPMVATSSAFKLVRFSSALALSLCAATAGAQSTGGMGGVSNGGAPSSGGANVGGAENSGAGGQSGGTSAGGQTASGGASSAGAPNGAAGMSTGGASASAGMSGGGAPTGAAGMSGGGTSGSGGMSSGNLVTNGTFDTTSYSPWWGYANNTTDNPADEALAVTNGQLCATMMAGGKNVWDVLIGLSNVVLLPNQYYHVHFTVTADAARTIKFKTGAGVAPYTDYFIESVAITATPTTATPQAVDYTFLNLRNDPMAQFQFQIGSTGGTVCVDDIVLEPVATPTMPSYTTPAHSGHPFKDYKAMVKMGTAVDTPIFLSNPLHNSIVAGEFAMITPANSMKMNLIQPTQGVFDYTDTDALVDFAQKNNLEFHGHPLIWHTQTPSWLTDGMFDADQLTAIMYAQIDGVMGHYAGKFPYWDVVNEAVDNASGSWSFRSTVWHDTIGDDFIDLAFQHARMTDPNAKLLYNDYNIEQKGNGKADYVFNMVSSMKSRGIPIDAIGFQGHYFIEPDGTTKNGVPDMQAIADNMARYNDIGVEVHITECDFRVGKPLSDMKTQVQNKFYADLLQVCINAPNCSHFTVWGLSDLDSWVPGTFPDYDYAHLWDNMLMPKPDYFAMSDVFAQYVPGSDGTPIMGGMAGGSGMAGSSGTGMAGSGSTMHPAAKPASSSGGCSLTAQTSRTDGSLVALLAMVGVLVSRRRSKRADS
jgi:endo-1,4-beta-xylanase